MWLCTSNAFLSIVHKDCKSDELLVRARVAGHIESVFPDAEVQKTMGTDYLFRAVIKRTVVADALVAQAMGNTYDNFKNSVRDNKLHSAFNSVWHVMVKLQPIAPWTSPSRKQRGFDL